MKLLAIARRLIAPALLLALVLAAQPAATAGEPPHGTLLHIKVHGASLAGNLEGDSPDRDVLVYLPPSYASHPRQRYPVIYNLHGYSVGADSWGKFLKWPGPLDHAFGAGAVRDMIVVMPDAQTLHNGSMYSNSVTTGDWEAYVTHDLVAYIDAHYRTIPERASRGLAGHSMGGYGTVRLGMKHPEVFSSIYIMSPCCLPPRTADGPGMKDVEAITTREAAVKAGFGVRATLSVAAAWSPNPHNPPFYVDLPTKDGVAQPDVIARWAANAPLAMVYQYIPSLKSFHAIGLEIGLQDPGLKDSQALDRILTDFGVTHTFETYEGTHTSRIAERVETKMLPFFDRNLSFAQPGHRH